MSIYLAPCRPLSMIPEQAAVPEQSRYSDFLTLAALPTAANSARSFVIPTLTRWKAPLAIEDAAMLATELVTSAVRATGVADPTVKWGRLNRLELVEVRLYGRRRSIVMEVWDANPIPRCHSPEKRAITIARYSTCWKQLPHIGATPNNGGFMTTTSTIPTHIDADGTLRVKIIDACGLTCVFCHNEGTPVAADNLNRSPGKFVPFGRTGRASIYATTNGATFLPVPVLPDDDYVRALVALRQALGANELHLTGGEPTLHPGLPKLVALARRAGFMVGMTSNGERGAEQMAACAKAGLDRVNFSIFGTTPAELAAVQHARYGNPVRATRKLDALSAAVQAAVDHGVTVSANIVVPDHSHVGRVHRLLDEYAPQLSVRLLNSLDQGQASIDAIEQALSERGAVPEARYVTAGVSGSRTAYRLPDGRRVYFKQIRRVRLPETCAGCRFNNNTDCEEGFYGVRLYRDRDGRYQVGVCIQRMDLARPLDDFLASGLPDEIRAFRQADYATLTAEAAR